MTMDFGAMMGALPAIADAVPQVVEQATNAQATLERIAVALEKIANNTAVMADYLVLHGTMPDLPDIDDEP